MRAWLSARWFVPGSSVRNSNRDEDAEEREMFNSGEAKDVERERLAATFFSQRSLFLLVLLLLFLALGVVFSSPTTPTPAQATIPPTIPVLVEKNTTSSPTSSPTRAEQEEEDVLGEISLNDESKSLEMNCTEEAFAQIADNSSYAYKLRLANCGGRTSNVIPKSNRAFRIYLVGEDLAGANLHLSGCPVAGYEHGGGCPFFPRCTFHQVKMIHKGTHNPDMIVVTSKEYRLSRMAMRALAGTGAARRLIRVLYQREPYWHPAPRDAQLSDFDMTMTGFVNAGVMNPPFLRRPNRFFSATPLVEFVPFQRRTGFALSIISQCNASSKRKIYLTHLTDYLGKDRVHQYGRCGHFDLPPPPVTNAAKVIAQYKFFLAFENSLLTNYISEKLLTVLTMPLIPVYRGGLPSLNITKKPSFIDVSQFASPKALAIYLLRLDAFPEEYAKYHEWRTDPEPFTDEYLDLVARQLPGQLEMAPYKQAMASTATRRAVCCRLCDEQIVAHARELHGERSVIPVKIYKETLNQFSFNGTLGVRHPGTLLVPDGNGSFVESGVFEGEDRGNTRAPLLHPQEVEEEYAEEEEEDL